MYDKKKKNKDRAPYVRVYPMIWPEYHSSLDAEIS